MGGHDAVDLRPTAAPPPVRPRARGGHAPGPVDGLGVPRRLPGRARAGRRRGRRAVPRLRRALHRLRPSPGQLVGEGPPPPRRGGRAPGAPRLAPGRRPGPGVRPRAPARRAPRRGVRGDRRPGVLEVGAPLGGERGDAGVAAGQPDRPGPDRPRRHRFPGGVAPAAPAGSGGARPQDPAGGRLGRQVRRVRPPGAPGGRAPPAGPLGRPGRRRRRDRRARRRAVEHDHPGEPAGTGRPPALPARRPSPRRGVEGGAAGPERAQPPHPLPRLRHRLAQAGRVGGPRGSHGRGRGPHRLGERHHPGGRGREGGRVPPHGQGVPRGTRPAAPGPRDRRPQASAGRRLQRRVLLGAAGAALPGAHPGPGDRHEQPVPGAGLAGVDDARHHRALPAGVHPGGAVDPVGPQPLHAAHRPCGGAHPELLARREAPPRPGADGAGAARARRRRGGHRRARPVRRRARRPGRGRTPLPRGGHHVPGDLQLRELPPVEGPGGVVGAAGPQPPGPPPHPLPRRGLRRPAGRRVAPSRRGGPPHSAHPCRRLPGGRRRPRPRRPHPGRRGASGHGQVADHREPRHAPARRGQESHVRRREAGGPRRRLPQDSGTGVRPPRAQPPRPQAETRARAPQDPRRLGVGAAPQLRAHRVGAPPGGGGPGGPRRLRARPPRHDRLGHVGLRGAGLAGGVRRRPPGAGDHGAATGRPRRRGGRGAAGRGGPPPARLPPGPGRGPGARLGLPRRPRGRRRYRRGRGRDRGAARSGARRR